MSHGQRMRKMSDILHDLKVQYVHVSAKFVLVRSCGIFTAVLLQLGHCSAMNTMSIGKNWGQLDSSILEWKHQIPFMDHHKNGVLVDFLFQYDEHQIP